MHKLRCLHLSAAVLAFAALVGMEARSAELERRAPVPAAFGRTGCPTATAGQNRAAARIPAAHRIGHQRVKPTARHTTIFEAPADLGTWSTAVDRKRTIAVSGISYAGSVRRRTRSEF